MALIIGCQQQTSPATTPPALNTVGTPQTAAVQPSQDWCEPLDWTDISGRYIVEGIVKGYAIEGKAYDVCHDKRFNEKSILVQERWYTKGMKTIKTTMLDTDDKYGTTTDWVNDAGKKCTKIEKEGISDALICR